MFKCKCKCTPCLTFNAKPLNHGFSTVTTKNQIFIELDIKLVYFHLGMNPGVCRRVSDSSVSMLEATLGPSPRQP